MIPPLAIILPGSVQLHRHSQARRGSESAAQTNQLRYIVGVFFRGVSPPSRRISSLAFASRNTLDAITMRRPNVPDNGKPSQPQRLRKGRATPWFFHVMHKLIALSIGLSWHSIARIRGLSNFASRGVRRYPRTVTIAFRRGIA